MNAQSRQSCFSTMLDVRSWTLAARRATQQASPEVAVFLLILFGLIGLAVTPIWISYDLASTWEFTTSVREGAAPAIVEFANSVDRILDMRVAALLSGIIFTSFTLLPSLFELAFPSVVHPLLNLILTVSIIFDYVTDWGKAYELAGNWTTSGGIQFLYAVPVCAFMSVGAQAVLAICITVCIFCVIALIRGGRGGNAQPIIIQQ